MAPAAQAATYTVNVQTGLDIGTVVAASAGDTIFRINPSTGAVTVQSGDGRRLSGSSVRAMVSVTCRPGRGNDNACLENNVPIRVAAIGAITGRTKALTNFTAAMGTASLATPPAGTSPITFSLTPLGNDTARTFFIGADFGVSGDDSGKPSGVGENNFVVSVTDGNGATLASDTDKGRLTAFRALTAAKTADLGFGRIGRPTTGSSTVTLDTAGVRMVTGDAIAFPTPATTAAGFTVSGEGGQSFSGSIPATLQLNGPGTITVTLTHTLPGAPTLSGALGQAGSRTFNVGGSFTITSTTSTGAYSGVLTVSIDYN